MIKLYDLVFEEDVKRLRNNLDLGEKNEEFQEKLDTMSPKDQNILVPLVRKLISKGGKPLEEFKSLLNRYSSVNDLQPPKTILETTIAKIKEGQAGPGELLFHLELQDSKMDVGTQTNHDLIVKGKIWEVKKVGKNGGPFRLAKKGQIGNFKIGRNLYRMVDFLDKVTNLLPKLEDDFDEISPRLLKALRLWDKLVTSKFTPKEAIFRGGHSMRFRSVMKKIINAVKDEIEVNTDDEFTTVKFGGINVIPKDKGIDPVSIQNIDDDSVTLNFIGKDTLKVLEVLNELPYAKDEDFDIDLDTAVEESLEDMPAMIIFSFEGKIAIFEKDELVEKLKFYEISQNNLTLTVKPEVWAAL